MAADLFCGAGGASLGLIAAGIDVVYALDADADAIATYRANVGDHAHLGRIEDVVPADIPDVDLIHGSPPCQGFSFAGLRDPNDPRNLLWREFFRIVAAKQPAWITVENVRGMLNSGESRALVEEFAGLGYRVTPHLLNAADYGVPQSRDRVFFVGNRIGTVNPAPEMTHWGLRPAERRSRKRHLTPLLGLASHVTVRQALGIGGKMSQKYSVTDRPETDGRTSPWYDGDEQPARTLSHEPHKIVMRADPYHPERERSIDEPAATVNTGSRSDHIPAIYSRVELDAPSRTIKAGGMRDQSGHRGGPTPPSIPILMRDKGKDDGARSVVFDAGDVPMRTIKTDSRFEVAVPNIPLDEPSPTILGGAAGDGSKHTGGPEPVRHRLNIGQMFRRLTVLECQLLQDFPPDFAFAGSKTSQHRQIGNAVPMGLARAVGFAIIDAHQAAQREAPESILPVALPAGRPKSLGSSKP